MAYVIFDTETTGLSPQAGDRMIEIAAVRVMNGTITEETFEALINPGRLVAPESTRIHGITDEMVKDAPPASTVIPEFLEFVGSDHLVAHNAEFDMAFLRFEMEQLGLDTSSLPQPLCTVVLARKELPQLPRHNLDTLTEHFGLTIDRRHRALDDVIATAQIFIQLHQEEPSLF